MRNHRFAMPTSDIYALLLGRSWLVPALYSLFIAMLALCGVAVAYVLYVFMRRRIVAYRSPLQNLPGPKNEHWFKGNFVDVREPDSLRLQEEWIRTYGHVLKYHSGLAVRHFSIALCRRLPFQDNRAIFFVFNLAHFDPQSPKLLAIDPVAVSYVLQNSDTFQKSEILRFHLGVATGRGMYDGLFLGPA